MNDQLSIEDLERQLAAANEALRTRLRLEKLAQGRKEFLPFLQLMNPDPEDPADCERTLYQDVPHAKLLREIIESVVRGSATREAVSIPPQHGKTLHLAISAPAFIWGLNPRAKIIVVTYNSDRAAELGDDFKAAVESPAYAQIFPAVTLSPSAKGKHHMRTTVGGRITFVGRGGGVTGKSADYFIVDDPLKDDEEAGSDAVREKLWTWFFSVAYSRGGNSTRMIVLHTRWHEDDLIGRLCDPEHPERKKRFANVGADWNYTNVPGVVRDPKLAKRLGLTLEAPTDPAVLRAFGPEPVSALWTGEKDLRFFAQWKAGDARTFGALVMGDPSPEDGAFFLEAGLREYGVEDLPRNLERYGASDHAATESKRSDPSVAGCVGVDPDGDIWVLPDLVWRRMEPDALVEAMIDQMERHRPRTWWMEDENISKGFGPFLREGMRKRKVHTHIVPAKVSQSKRVRASSAQGRLSLGTVHFPAFAPWWADAKAELLKFPYGAHDDFVDWLAHICRGLDRMIPADAYDGESENVVIFDPVARKLATVRAQVLAGGRKPIEGFW